MKSFRTPCVASMQKEKKTDAMQRYSFFDRKACITDINNDRTPCSVQRHTISREKTCVASMRKEKKADAMQQYTISGEKSCVATREGSRSLTAVQRHTFSQAKTCVASTEREKKTNRSHTTLHNTIRSSHKTTTHHITSYHIISQPYPNPTTLPTDKTPYHASNTIHYNTIQQKPFLPKAGGRALLISLRTD